MGARESTRRAHRRDQGGISRGAAHSTAHRWPRVRAQLGRHPRKRADAATAAGPFVTADSIIASVFIAASLIVAAT